MDEYEPAELDELLTAYYSMLSPNSLSEPRPTATRSAASRFGLRRQSDGVQRSRWNRLGARRSLPLQCREDDLRHWLTELEDDVRTLLEEIEAVESGERAEPTMAIDTHRQDVEKKYRLLQRHTRRALTELGMATGSDVTREKAFEYATRAEHLRSIALDAVVLFQADTEERKDTVDVATSLLTDDKTAGPLVERRSTVSETRQQSEQ